jgi:hypothetical protein
MNGIIVTRSLSFLCGRFLSHYGCWDNTFHCVFLSYWLPFFSGTHCRQESNVSFCTDYGLAILISSFPKTRFVQCSATNTTNMIPNSSRATTIPTRTARTTTRTTLSHVYMSLKCYFATYYLHCCSTRRRWCLVFAPRAPQNGAR